MRLLSTLSFAALVACGGPGTAEEPFVDSDNDGLSDSEEKAMGLDPNNSDSDGDGLSDKEEIDLGADPLLVDTDGDGYTDRDEVHEGKDPTDANSRIYKGNWPYVYDKDSIPGGSTTGNAEIGKRFGRFQFKDQFGDTVDLFDFHNADKPVVIDISAQWCPPCRGMAAWMDGQGDTYQLGNEWSAGPEVVDRGDVYWITIMGENFSYLPATKKTATEWYTEFPSEAIPVLADNAYLSVDYAAISSWPTLLLLEPDLKVAVFNRQNYYAVLWELDFRFPE